MKYALSLLLSVMITQISPASRWYVSPDGASSNPGTREDPWDIASALGGEHNVEPGDTIVLLEGTYRRRPKELYEVRLVGTGDAPIHIRAARGQRVRIDGGLSMQSPSAHVWVRDLEVFVSEPTPGKPVSPGSHPEDLDRPWGGLHMFGGTNCKYIDLVIHSCNQGISCWKGEIDPEIYGCIIYGNGWLGTDRGHGHCIYTQNDDGVKTISNCIMSCPHDGSYTVHAYGSQRAYVNNFLLVENICYNRGPFLIGGGRPSKNIRVLKNCLYGIDMRIGYTAPYNENCEIRDNIIVNGGLNITRYRRLTQQGNLIIAKNQERPKGARSILLPNRYDENRAHLAVYNCTARRPSREDRAETVEVKAEPFLRAGDPYCLMDPEDFFAEPIARGRCDGETIRVPVKGEFGAFVVVRK
ncbi:MAG: right-handed parallel beta-helix repeat-containing protein [Planctomycetota bacterium]